MHNALVLCALTLFVAWYYWTKYMETERAYCKVYQRLEHAISENDRLKSKITDLSLATVEPLTAEALNINTLPKEQPRVPLLTQEVLTSLFTPELGGAGDTEAEADVQSLPSGEYDQYLIRETIV